MTPNLKKGKTEIVFSPIGKGSREFRKSFFGPSADGFLHVIGEHAPHAIAVVGHYTHLGGVLHHRGDLHVEVKKKLAVAHQTFSSFRRLLLHNVAFSLE